MLGSDAERTHMSGDEVQGPTATPAIIYPVHSVVVTTAPVSETSSFGIVKLQADVTGADQASSTARAMVYVESQERTFQFHSSGCLQDIPVSSIAGLVDSSSTSSDVITLTEEVYKNCLESVNGNEEGLTDKEEERYAGCTRFLGHCCDTWTGVGSSEQLWGVGHASLSTCNNTFCTRR